MRRRLLLVGGAVAFVLVAFAIHRFVFGGSDEGGTKGAAANAGPASVIGSGDTAVAVSARGTILIGRPPPPEGSLPRLPLDRPPKSGRLAGPVLQQALVLGAAPKAIRPCVESSRYGESGVDVELYPGIELRFGSASRAARKWSAALAILADPSTTGIGYVDLHSPSRVSTGGTGPTLPEPEPGKGPACGE